MMFAVLALLPIAVAIGEFASAWPDNILPRVGIDFEVYRQAAARWLDGDGYFLPHQLAGPYVITHGDVLYPPPALALFAPFTVVPSVLWWAIPIAIVAWSIWRLHPAPWAWPLMALALWWPETTFKLVTGGPVMWVVAFLSLGAVFAWPAALVIMKPTMAPFALLGSWDRRWWGPALMIGLLALAFLPMWPDYITAIANSSNPLGMLYSTTEYPILALPMVAWLARRRTVS